MRKSIHSRDYGTFCRLLREARERSGLTQADVAKRLDESQSFVSKCERAERRLDVIELGEFCKAMDLSLTTFIRSLERALR